MGSFTHLHHSTDQYARINRSTIREEPEGESNDKSSATNDKQTGKYGEDKVELEIAAALSNLSRLQDKYESMTGRRHESTRLAQAFEMDRVSELSGGAVDRSFRGVNTTPKLSIRHSPFYQRNVGLYHKPTDF